MKRRAFITLLGAAFGWPHAVLAQGANRVRKLGILMSTIESDPLEQASVDAFISALGKLGWVKGQNLEVLYRWGAGDAQRMNANARELVGLAPDVLLVKGANLPAAQRATTAIPIIFVVLSDATAEHYVGRDFSRPSGNLTGFTSYERELVGKRLTLLREFAPRLGRLLYIRGRNTGTDTRPLYDKLAEDARTINLAVADAPAENADDIERVMRSFGRDPNGAVIVAFDAFTAVHRAKIVDLAAQLRLPAIYPLPSFVRGGGLCSYGFDQDDQFRQAASYAARILNGERLGDMPVQTPSKFEFLINSRTAKALGLQVPPSLLATADEVIE